SRKKSIATVDAKGLVTAKKHGTATITATVDGVTKECEVTVVPPAISLSKTSVSLKKGRSLVLNAKVSSGIKPVWTSSKSSVASVNKEGKVTARKKGSCYIYAAEDGTKKGCHITVTA
ncbi:MAG: Ig-like domain-containing protein, partial [Eubacterium sp.]|nr:Ig-like domain-containing protein [Eubacterium sp.]